MIQMQWVRKHGPISKGQYKGHCQQQPWIIARKMMKCTHITLISTSPVNSHILPSLRGKHSTISKYPSIYHFYMSCMKLLNFDNWEGRRSLSVITSLFFSFLWSDLSMWAFDSTQSQESKSHIGLHKRTRQCALGPNYDPISVLGPI